VVTSRVEEDEFVAAIRAGASGYREATDLLRDGRGTREIAERLGISQVTVRRHLSSTYTKLGVDSRADALRLLERA
jgi:DNA-binding NarL/FixJ family response regulator